MATTSDESFDVDDKSNGNSSFFTPLENSFELSNDASNSEIKQSGSTIVNSDSEFDEGNEAELTKLMEQRKQRRLSRRSQRFTALPSDSEDDDEVIESSLVEMNLVSDDDNEIPETDDEMVEESRIQCYSPRTRMSISGIRPADLESDSDDDDLKPIEFDAATDGNKSMIEVFDEIATDAASINPNKRTRRSILNSSMALNESLNASLIRTPEPKRYSLSKEERDVAIVEEEEQNTMNNESAISHIIDSSASESNSVIAIDDSDDGEATTDLTWTPEKSKPALIQPKLRMLRSSTESKHVSQEHYDTELEKINKLAEDLKTCQEIYPSMKQSLPDKGVNLWRRIESLKKEISVKQKQLNNLIVTEEMPKIKTKVAAAMPSWADIEAGTKSIVPKYTGAQGLNTFIEQKSEALDRLHSLHEALETRPTEDTLAPTPFSLKIELMHHQRYGLKWMMWREKLKPRGGILADDMGLGKTLSVIALILATNEQQGDNEGEDEDDDDDDDETFEETRKYEKMGFTAKGRVDYYYGGTLVVCPASLIEQWQSEAEKRVKRHSMSVKLHHGNSRETNARRLSKNDLVITTYGLVSSEAKTAGPLHQIKWERIVLDEAHIIRNHTTAAALACCRLKGTNRWTLTGTPVQNKEMDLYSLLKFLKCTPFSNLPVYKKWINTSSQGGRDRLTNILKPLMLRRTKAELQDKGELTALTNKNVEEIIFESAMAERNVYSMILGLSRTLFGQYLSQHTERVHINNMADGSGRLPPYARKTEPNAAYSKMYDKFSKMKGPGGEVKSYQILVLITRLRQICNHPGLIDSMLEDDNNNVEQDDSDDGLTPELDLLAELGKLNLNESQEDNVNFTPKNPSKILLRSNPVFDLKNRSSKCIEVIKLINKIQAETNDKIVIVSQWTSVLDIISRFLREDCIRHTELTGKTPIKLRNGIVESFNAPNGHDKVMLLSLVAGGVGLNLAGANHLILMDPHWNPQLEAQAQDRVYRVGQTKPVRIYKFLCKETIEIRIKQLQEYKLELSQQVLTGSVRNISKLNMDDMKKLFDM